MKNRMFRQIMLSYILILLIPTAINWATNITGTQVLRENSAQYEMRRLQDIIDETDKRIDGIKDTARQLSSEARVLSLLNAPDNFERTPFLSFYHCIGTVYNYLSPKSYIQYTNYYLYFQRYNYIMINETLYAPGLYHFAKLLKLNPQETLEENWSVWIRAPHFGGDFVYDDYSSVGYPEVDSIIYIQTLPVTYNPKGRGAFVIELPKSGVRELFLHGQSENTFGYIEDADGKRVLSAGNAEIEFLNVKLAETKAVSELTGWSFVTLTPENELYAAFLEKKKLLYVLTGAVLTVGAILAFWFANSNTKPLVKATDAINNYFGGKRESYTLTQGVSRLISDQTALRRDLAEQKPYLLESFLSGLLHGRVYSQQEIEELTKYLGLDFLNGGNFFVALFRLYNENDKNFATDLMETLSWKSVVRAELAKTFPNGLVHDVDQKHTAIIFNDNSDFVETFTLAYTAMNSGLKQAYKMGVFAALSSRCQTVTELWRGMWQCEYALRYAWGERAALYDELPAEEFSYYYPIEMESRLMSFIKNGDATQADAALDIIYQENTQRRTLTVENARELIVELRATLSKASPKNKEAEAKVREIKNINGFDATFTLIRKLCAELCAFGSTTKNDSSNRVISSILTYIKENYSDPGLGLYPISTRFNLSEGYLSSFFKANTGMNFTDYLEKIRLEKACELLSQTDRTIADIALQVGYNSDQSFRRAFKRVYGSTPNKARETKT